MRQTGAVLPPHRDGSGDALLAAPQPFAFLPAHRLQHFVSDVIACKAVFGGLFVVSVQHERTKNWLKWNLNIEIIYFCHVISFLQRWSWRLIELLLRSRRFRNPILLPSLCSSVSVFQLLTNEHELCLFIYCSEVTNYSNNYWAKYLRFFPLQLLQLSFG